ncbi:histidinol-phosphate transaminase [Commensalibacter oyaizuii]|uniref:Histidinol-phosphate aminotransferase n=1 Tax=Commensalibacter oyaizuii TaxID=3043873 RepID=A0ABT6Q2P2_9PROT|nr:histidinol-phosphate transaminase [Commensalibacter sp. TBRC 16381]MDI2091393.1 histidinol-phosphate transaminase [Commensalibacter sp. TBRC 16381]
MHNQYWSPFVNNIVPYVPGEQPKATNLIKLNTNENAYGVSPKVLQALKETVQDTLKLYPDPTAQGLCDALADLHEIDSDHIFVGNGSDEVLGLAFFALLKHEKPILFPDITYSFYSVYCNLFNISYKCIPLTNDFHINLQAYEQEDAAGIVIANPNAPTGLLLDNQNIEHYLNQHPKQVVIIDEAYIDFGGKTVIPLTKQYPNLLVIRTFSKFYALAGLRVGYAVGNPHLIEGIRRVKDSFNSYPLDRLAQAGAIAAVQDIKWSLNSADRIIKNRNYLTHELAQLGFTVLNSKANFVFASHPHINSEKIATYLRQNNILIRHFSTPRIKDWLRITIGTEDECKILIDKLQRM